MKKEGQKIRLGFLLVILFCTVGLTYYFLLPAKEKMPNTISPSPSSLVEAKLNANINIYHPSKDINEVEEVVGQKELIPQGYEIAVSVPYKVCLLYTSPKPTRRTP